MESTTELLARINGLERSSRVAIPFGILAMLAILGSIYFGSVELKRTREEVHLAEGKLAQVRAETEAVINQTQAKLDELNKTLELTLANQKSLSYTSDIKSAIEQVERIDASLAAASAKYAAAMPTTTVTRFGTMNVDIFYCANGSSVNGDLARQLLTLREGQSTGNWRVRELSPVVNATEGYSLSKDVIRFNTDEREIAQKLKEDIDKASGHIIGLQEIAYPTPGYISVFLCKSRK